MRRVIVEYKLKPGRAAENEQLIGAVYEELHRSEPSGLHYATFKLEDGLTYVHIAAEADDRELSLSELPAFGRFSADISERCAEPPRLRELSEVGSFALLGA
jgi:hypothetical protein